MLGQLTFVSLARLGDAGAHQAYNEWHQLDHRPENLALDGVAWGERWVRSPRAAALTTETAGPLSDFHYLNMYWFTGPLDRTLGDWEWLAERSAQWGRRDDLELCARPLMDYFVPVSVDVAPRLRLSAAALPVRPNRGVHVEVVRWPDGRMPEALAAHRWFDRVRIGQLLAVDGVAGVCVLASQNTFLTHQDLGTAADPSSTRIHLTYLDGELAETAAALAQPTDAPTTEGELLHAGILESIVPWQWDWFNEAPPP